MIIDLRIVVLINVDILFWNCKGDTLRLHTPVEHSLDHCVGVQGTAIDYAVGLASTVSKLTHDLTVFCKELVQVRVVNA